MPTALATPPSSTPHAVRPLDDVIPPLSCSCPISLANATTSAQCDAVGDCKWIESITACVVRLIEDPVRIIVSSPHLGGVDQGRAHPMRLLPRGDTVCSRGLSTVLLLLSVSMPLSVLAALLLFFFLYSLILLFQQFCLWDGSVCVECPSSGCDVSTLSRIVANTSYSRTGVV